MAAAGVELSSTASTPLAPGYTATKYLYEADASRTQRAHLASDRIYGSHTGRPAGRADDAMSAPNLITKPASERLDSRDLLALMAAIIFAGANGSERDAVEAAERILKLIKDGRLVEKAFESMRDKP